jgi:hypothetical protein
MIDESAKTQILVVREKEKRLGMEIPVWDYSSLLSMEVSCSQSCFRVSQLLLDDFVWTIS